MDHIDTVSLKEFFEARFSEMNKTLSEINHRLEGLGQWRDTVNRKLTTLETRSVTWTAAMGVFFVIATLVMHWLKK